jgi:hypothetical protein
LNYSDNTQALAKSPLTKKYDLRSVRDIGSGAAPLGGEVIEEAEALWPEGDRKLQVPLLVSLNSFYVLISV